MSTIGCVVLSYQKAHIFERFWDSLMAQTRLPDQIVIVDDGSTDGTTRLFDRILLDDRFADVTVHHTARIRQSAARNYGLKRIATDRVIFLDGDLLLQVNMLGRMEVEMDEHPETSFVYCPYDRTGAQQGRIAALPWSVDRLKTGNYISPMSLVRRTDLPEPCFDEELHRYEDWDLWIRMAKAGHTGRLINEMLFTAYYLEGDLSGRGEHQDWFFRVKAKHGIPA
jgi:glycosyltransferase involved in cell wall biosynthesis